MAGTHCITGSASGIVVSTGDNTVFGQIAKLTSAPKTGLTPLQKEIYYFVTIIVGLMLSMILLVIIVWSVRFISAMSILVSIADKHISGLPGFVIVTLAGFLFPR
jgi:magnesium-transporting ATPase (P-type)